MNKKVLASQNIRIELDFFESSVYRMDFSVYPILRRRHVRCDFSGEVLKK